MGTPQEYLKELTIESDQNYQKLRAVVRGCRALQDSIKKAAELGEPPPTKL